MRSHKLLCPLVVAGTLVWGGGCAEKDTPNVEGTVAVRPYGTDELRHAVPFNSIYLFEDRSFGGEGTRVSPVTGFAPQAYHPVGGRADNLTSLRWSLPRGVVVTFYEDAEGDGDTVTIWGDGEVDSVSQWKFNDDASRWSWAYVGGAEDQPREVLRGFTPRPRGAQALDSDVPMNTVRLYHNRDFKGGWTDLDRITAEPQGARINTRLANDKATSVRWNLPDGVVVVLYEDLGGFGRQLALYGAGQYETVSPFNLNDKISRFAWFNVGGSMIR